MLQKGLSAGALAHPAARAMNRSRARARHRGFAYFPLSSDRPFVWSPLPLIASSSDRLFVWSPLRLIDTDIVVLPESAHPRAFCPLILIAWERGVENKSHLAVQPSRQPNILVFLRTLNWCLISSYNCETHLTSTFHLYLFNMPGTFCLLSDRMCFISSQNTPAVKWLQTHWVHNHTLLSP